MGRPRSARCRDAHSRGLRLDDGRVSKAVGQNLHRMASGSNLTGGSAKGIWAPRPCDVRRNAFVWAAGQLPCQVAGSGVSRTASSGSTCACGRQTLTFGLRRCRLAVVDTRPDLTAEVPDEELQAELIRSQTLDGARREVYTNRPGPIGQLGKTRVVGETSKTDGFASFFFQYSSSYASAALLFHKPPPVPAGNSTYCEGWSGNTSNSPVMGSVCRSNSRFLPFSPSSPRHFRERPLQHRPVVQHHPVLHAPPSPPSARERFVARDDVVQVQGKGHVAVCRCEVRRGIPPVQRRPTVHTCQRRDAVYPPTCR